MHRLILSTVLSMMSLTLAFAAGAAEQPSPSADAGAAPPVSSRGSGGGITVQIPANGAPILLEVNKGTLVRLPRPASTVFVANPDIADVQIKSPSLIYISAKAPGQTVIYAVDANDSVLLNAPIRVELDVSRLRQSFRQLLPGESPSVAGFTPAMTPNPDTPTS
jgi:Flp pilus assembly secretin CpaC